MSALISTTDAGGSPDVPDAAATTKWKQYLWIRQAGSATIPKIYAWNDSATSDSTYLKWQEKASLDANSVLNSHVNSSAAIAYSKLALTNGIVNADINASAAIASTKLATIPYSKLNLSGSIVNADITAGTIEQDKLEGHIPIGKLSLSSSAGITNTHINTGAAIDSAKLATVPYSKLNLSNSVVNADVKSDAAIAYSKLAVSDGDIPFSKLSISNGDISNLTIDRLYEKRLEKQGSSQTSSGNVLTVPAAGKQLDGLYRGIMVSSGSQTIILPDPAIANCQINNSSGYANGATSLTVDSLPQELFSGQVITFEGQQTFTLSANASAGATTLNGKLVAGSTLTDNQKGYVYDGISFRLSIFKAGGTGKVDVRVAGFVPTAGTYSGSHLTITLPTNHGITTSDLVTVTGMTPDYYNVTNAQVTNATTTQITYANQTTTTPAANATGFGLARRSEKLVNNATGILSDSITVLPTSPVAENKKVLIHCICDSDRGDGQWLIGGIPSYSSTVLQAEVGQTFSKEVKRDLPTNTKYFRVHNANGYAVNSNSQNIVIDNAHGLTAAIGDKIMFANGGLLTLTAAVSSTNQASLSGVLSLFPIENDEFGHLVPRDEDNNILESGRLFKTAFGTAMFAP